jgi:CBS domain-containing protein
VPHVAVRPSDPLSRLLQLRDVYRVLDFVVVDSTDHYVGMVTAQDLRTALIEREAIPYLLVAELVRQDIPTVSNDEALDQAFRKFSDFDVSSLPLVKPSANADEPPIVQGLLTRARLMQRYHDELKASS